MENEKTNKKSKIGWILMGMGLLLLIIALLLIFLPKPKDITISFDPKGGVPVEEITVKEGTIITLPEATKKGYTFDGWYWNDIKLDKNVKAKENMTLIAKWILNPKTDPVITFEVTFDSKGGSEVEKMTLECGKGIKLPQSPKRHKYNFLGWLDRYGNKVENSDLLACENQTLTAKWEKIIEYTCPEGYTLSGRECYVTMDAEKKCKDKELDIGNSTCLRDYKEDSKCGTKSIYYQNGNVEKTEGDYIDGMCYYGIEEQFEEGTCITTFGEGHYKRDACYVEIGEEVNECPVNHIYFTEEQLKRKTNQDKGKAGCYEMVDYSSFCTEENYKLENDHCVKKIAATVKE